MQVVISAMIAFFLMSCDSFNEGVEDSTTPNFSSRSFLVNIDCSALILSEMKISKVKFFMNGSFLKQMSGFEIQKAKLCPKLSFDDKKDRVTLEVFYGANSSKKCRLSELKITCD